MKSCKRVELDRGSGGTIPALSRIRFQPEADFTRVQTAISPPARLDATTIAKLRLLSGFAPESRLIDLELD
jgi:hypothetical protein